MTTAILVLGLGLALALAILMRHREWRLPAFAFALLALPGNVDDLFPQMRLDPYDIADNTAAAVSMVDLLLVWAVILTARERGPLRIPRWIFALAGILATLAVVSAAAAAVRGVEPLAALRGALVFGRIVAVLYISGSLVGFRRDAFRLSLAFVAGGVSLIGNGLYTSTVQALDRFTATTFGRNSFAIALIVCAILAAGVVFSRWHRRRTSRHEALVVGGSAVVAAASLFGAVATGTRMSMIVLAGAAALILIVNVRWRSIAGLRRVAIVAALTIAVIGSAGVLTTGGARAISVFGSVDEVTRGVTDPESLPIYSEIRSRGDFWALAVKMAVSNPLFGVGPFQWNIERYELANYEPLVADPHNSYLQVAAEYGIPVAALYALLVATCLVVVLLAAWNPKALSRTDWSVAAVAGAALVIPLADATNSNLFNTRMGLVAWLLLAVAVAYATWSPRQAEPVPEDAGTAPGPPESADRDPD